MSLVPESGRLVGGRYRLEKVLGEGGMAVVWRAVHTETDRGVALKLVRSNLCENDQARELFVREARIAARIGRSEHIVDVLDAGIDVELAVPFMVMELCEGETLDVRLRREGPIAAALAADLVEQLADGLDQAHAAGVIHRDLKPQNLFLSKDRKGRTVIKILDFGIAKLSETALDSATQIGTPAYSAPEQLGESWRTIARERGATIASTVTPGTDIWAFGLVVYEMLTGTSSGSIWAATTLAELPVKIVLEPTPRASARALDKAHLLPTGFDAWLASCLALDSARRWPKAGEAAKVLVPTLRGHAAPPALSSAPMSPGALGAAAGRTPAPGPAPQVQTGPPQTWGPGTPAPPMQRAQSYPQLQSPTLGYGPPPAHGPSYPPQMSAAPGWQPGPFDPRLVAWAAERRVELRPAHIGEIKSFEPWTYLPSAGRVGAELFAMVDDARVRIAEVYAADMISQAMGEERTIVALLLSPRARYRVALRSRQATGIADEIGRGLKLLDGLVGVSPVNAKSIGDHVLENQFELTSPSAQEGHAALTGSLRQLLVNGGFRGTFEMKPGALGVCHQAVRALDPAGLDFLLSFLVQAYRALA